MAGEELSTILSSLIEPAFEKVTYSRFDSPPYDTTGFGGIAWEDFSLVQHTEGIEQQSNTFAKQV